MNSDRSITWAFGGPLSALGSNRAWLVLGVVLAAGAIFAWFSYRSTPRRLSRWRRLVLTTVRLLFLGALLFSLANPVRTVHTVIHPPKPMPLPPQKLAVLVDRSDSMTRADNRGRTRLDDAAEIWRGFEPLAHQTFATVRYFGFGADLRPAANFEEALTRTGDTAETRLFNAAISILQSPAASRPDALVILTDGLDTTGAPAASMRDQAIAAGISLYLVPGSNRTKVEPYFRVREWRVPASSPPNTEVTLEATFEAFAQDDGPATFSLWDGDRCLAISEVPLVMGANLLPWNYRIQTPQSGQFDLTLRRGVHADGEPLARGILRVERSKRMRVLVYAGALDWGLRYLCAALKTEPDLEYLTLMNAGLKVSLATAAVPGGTIVGKLASHASAYDLFDCLILTDLYPQELEPEQVRALTEFVRAGGSVLFAAPPPSALPQYRAGALADLLPVIFDSDRAGMALASGAVRYSQLTPFRLTPAGIQATVFRVAGGGSLIPRFAEAAPVFRAKPGAEVLAVDPMVRDQATLASRILFASQTFGRGHTVFLGTDSLWRWKMSEPADSRRVETFWQQLLLSIIHRPNSSQVHFVDVPLRTRLGDAVRLKIAGTERGQMPAVSVEGKIGLKIPLQVRSESDPAAPWSAEWNPAAAGPWTLTAQVPGGDAVYAFSTVFAEPKGELAPTPTALDAMRAWAVSTGGGLLTRDAPSHWQKPAPEKPLAPYTRDDLELRWNRRIILMITLGLFAAELILRRIWKLV